jgi:hypothetical protein
VVFNEIERHSPVYVRFAITARPDPAGCDAKLIDWLDELTAECPKKMALNMNDPCGARCRDLAKVL